MVPEPGGNLKVMLGLARPCAQHTPVTVASRLRLQQQLGSALLHSSRRELVILNHFYRALYNTPPLFGSKSTFETLLDSNPVILLRIAHTGLVSTRQSVKPRDCGGGSLARAPFQLQSAGNMI